MISTSNATYSYWRMVRYGDCDASGNYYTPRALEYALEAVAGWYQDVLGIDWSKLVTRSGWQVAFLHAGCRYTRTLSAGEVVQLRVHVAGIEERQLRLTVSGRNDAGLLCFTAELGVCFTELRRLDPLQIPERYRRLVERYRDGSEAAQTAGESAAVGTAGDFLPCPVDGSTVPFVMQRRVAYGECGASGTMHPQQLFDHLLEATGGWYEKHLGISWLRQNRQGIGNPFLKVSCNQLRPILAGQLISSTVAVSRLGNSSICYAVAGYDEKGRPCFRAELTACYTVEENGALKPTPFPDGMRQKITAYQEACAPLVMRAA